MMPDKGKFAKRHPKPIGTSNKGSNPLANARYNSVRETMSIIICPIVSPLRPDSFKRALKDST
jgi:hypothetical protein